jgi:phosphoenolpyruvate carboxykinase (GTP)
VSARQCPSFDPAGDDPEGVPISAFIFGGRLSKTFPLVFEARNWQSGVYWAATMGSEATAAAVDQAAIRRDPFAMLPFCGYNMADYWKHWLGMTQNVARPPRIYRVNWFRKDEAGKFLWPGFGENMRVLKWIVDRVRGRAGATESPFGFMPRYEDLYWSGLGFPKEKYRLISDIDRAEGLEEAEDQADFFTMFGDRTPAELEQERRDLVRRLKSAPAEWTAEAAE